MSEVGHNLKQQPHSVAFASRQAAFTPCKRYALWREHWPDSVRFRAFQTGANTWRMHLSGDAATRSTSGDAGVTRSVGRRNDDRDLHRGIKRSLSSQALCPSQLATRQFSVTSD